MIKNYCRYIALCFCTGSFFLTTITIASTNKDSSNEDKVSEKEGKQVEEEKKPTEENYSLLSQFNRDSHRAVTVLVSSTILLLVAFAYFKGVRYLISREFIIIYFLQFLFVDFFIILFDELIYYLFSDDLEGKLIEIWVFRALGSIATALVFTMLYLVFGDASKMVKTKKKPSGKEDLDKVLVVSFCNYLVFLIISLIYKKNINGEKEKQNYEVSPKAKV